MRLTDFDYDLPLERIAQHPLAERSASRLLYLDGVTGALTDHYFRDLVALLAPGDLLVLNDTRVIAARLTGYKSSGGRVEVLVERVLNDHEVLAQVRASKPLKPGGRLRLEGMLDVEALARKGDLFELRFEDPRPVDELLDRYGHTPLPPYIRRTGLRRAEHSHIERQVSEDLNNDRARYQTVYASVPGAVAAPTAGLHFDAPLLARLADHGVGTAFVTLHVGAGTFQPIRVDHPLDHRMHPEAVEVPPATCAAIAKTHARGARVVAVGTTTLRALETAAQQGELAPFSGESELFIVPGFHFRVADALITNFHLPRSTLLMLACAFGGYASVMCAYRHAIAQGYRFYSYGDAMLIQRAPA